MPTIVHEFAWPDRLVVGTVGRPGDREFYLQARTKARIVTIALEKQQSAQLAEKIDEVLDELRSTEGNPFRVPDSMPVELVDNDPLDQPIDTQFRTGAMRLGWDPMTAQIVIEAYAMTDAEAHWRAQRTQQLLADGLDKFEAIAQVRQEARSAPWTAIK